jgi:hypothetical protein
MQKLENVLQVVKEGVAAITLSTTINKTADGK